MILRTIITWLALVALAILNGGFREAVLVPRLGPATAHVVSTILLCGLILAVSWFATPWIGPSTARAALVVGSIWLLMTLGFEFLAGHFLSGKAWPVLLAGLQPPGRPGLGLRAGRYAPGATPGLEEPKPVKPAGRGTTKPSGGCLCLPF